MEHKLVFLRNNSSLKTAYYSIAFLLVFDLLLFISFREEFSFRDLSLTQYLLVLMFWIFPALEARKAKRPYLIVEDGSFKIFDGKNSVEFSLEKLISVEFSKKAYYTFLSDGFNDGGTLYIEESRFDDLKNYLISSGYENKVFDKRN